MTTVVHILNLGIRFSVLFSGLGFALISGCARHIPETDLADGTAASMVRRSLDLRAGAAGAASNPADLGTPQGFATIKGVFRITGTPPQRVTVNVDKDVEVCAPGGRKVLDESVVVSSSGGLANVLIYLATVTPRDDPNWEHETYQATKTADVVFDQKNCVFLSHVFAMRATQKALIKNSDPVGHNTNLDSKRGARGGNFTIPVNTQMTYEPGAASPAPFPISCSIHPWMKAWMMVCDNPYFAVSNPEGEFEIANVPAGVPLEFRVWQEKGSLQQVTLNGAATKLPKGKLALKLTPGETKTLEVAIDASVFQ